MQQGDLLYPATLLLGLAGIFQYCSGCPTVYCTPGRRECAISSRQGPVMPRQQRRLLPHPQGCTPFQPPFLSFLVSPATFYLCPFHSFLLFCYKLSILSSLLISFTSGPKGALEIPANLEQWYHTTVRLHITHFFLFHYYILKPSHSCAYVMLLMNLIGCSAIYLRYSMEYMQANPFSKELREQFNSSSSKQGAQHVHGF